MLNKEDGRGSVSTIHLLHRAGQCADELFAEHVGGSGITPRQYAVLEAVANSDEPSQTTLVHLTGIDRSTLADIVRRLVERDLLQRRRTRRDARMYAVRLTDKGEEALREAAPAVKSTDERLLASLPEREREVFLSTLAKLVKALGTEAPGEAKEAEAHHHTGE